MGFQGTDGFCVYDDAGRLAFRVDNYSRRRKLCAGDLLLMDGQASQSARPLELLHSNGRRRGRQEGASRVFGAAAGVHDEQVLSSA